MRPLDLALFADENIHPDLIGRLRDQGKDVRSVHDTDCPCAPDGLPSGEPLVRLASLAPKERSDLNASITYEERASALINRASLPEGLDGESLDRLWARIHHPPGSPRDLWSRLASPLALAVLALLLMASGAVVGAETGVWLRAGASLGMIVRRVIGRQPAVQDQAPSGARRAPGRQLAGNQVTAAGSPSPTISLGSPPAPAPPSSTPQPAPPALEPIATATAAPGRARNPERAHLDGPTPRPPLAPSPRATPLADESLLLGRAIARLRQQRDPANALVDLDLYAARFSSGVLGHEAQRARVDALLMMGRLGEARAVLSNLTLGTGARDRELRLLRAELNAQSACAMAVEDFHAVMIASPSDPLAERALWGRAACRARLGDETGARADLAAYLARFPEGPHVAAARARLRN